MFFFTVESKGLTHVLIMDEVDGMSGNEDRAGVSFAQSLYLIVGLYQ